MFPYPSLHPTYVTCNKVVVTKLVQREIEKRREWVRDAMELGALPAPAAKGLARPVPKDLE